MPDLPPLRQLELASFRVPFIPRLKPGVYWPFLSTATYKRIKSEIDKIRVVDNHEHLKPESFRVNKGKPDFFSMLLSDYTGGDIENIGNTFCHDKKYLDRTLDIGERWESFRPVYERIKNTGYMRCLRLGIKKVHGIEITDASSIININESLNRLYQRGIYTKTLRDLGKIDYVLVYRGYEQFDRDAFPNFFRVVRYIDKMIIFTDPKDIHKLGEQYQIYVHFLEDLEKIYKKFVDQSIKDGVVGFKYAGAYYRTLDHTSFSQDKAEAILKELLRFAGRPAGIERSAITIKDGQELTDYCLNLMLKAIEEKGMPISIHTGLQAGGKTDIRWSNPQYLIPLFKEYKNVNFDLFHGGFPYVKEFVELGKSWPNVFLNLCWFHTISPEGARSLLSELLECVPVHKIFAFGADTNYPESTLGHLEMAKENCAIVLTEKVLNGYFTEEEALGYALKIFRTNSIEFFNLE
jgi:hypothetical protein